MNAGDSSARDSQRSKVYAAEEFVRTLFDRAAEHGSTSVEFWHAVDPAARGAVRVAGRGAALRGRRAGPAGTATTVAEGGAAASAGRRASTAADYENRDGAGVIAVPDLATADWAMRELVVLHEIAHHLCDMQPPHGSAYVATLCTLAELVMGPEAGHVLRVVYAKEGVR